MSQVRFAATVRAVGVWLGLPGDVTEIPKIADRVADLRRFRSDPAARSDALASGDPGTTYTALCALGMTDVHDALDVVERVLRRPERDVRAAAVRFLSAVGLRTANARLASTCADDDLAVATLAARGLDMNLAPTDTFERLEALADRLPNRARDVDGVGVEAGPVKLARAEVIPKMLRALGSRPPSVMLPWMADMDANARLQYASVIGQQAGKLTPDMRDVIITLVGDRSSHVRQAAVKVAEKLVVTNADARALEPLLSRGASDLRQAVIALLAKQGPAGAVASAELLWATGDASQRDAAAEQLAAAGTSHPIVREAAARIVGGGVSERQGELLATATGDAAMIDPGLGLYEAARRAPLRPIGRAKRRFAGETARRTMSALDDLAEAYRDTRLTVTTWQGSR